MKTKNIWRQLAAGAVLALFILSIAPFTLAEELTESTESTESDAPNNVAESQLRMKKKDAALKQAEAAREQHQKKKERYLEAQQAFLDKKGKLPELRRGAQCAEDTAGCLEKKKALKLGVKEHLAKTAELIGSSLEKLQEQVENSKVLTAEEKQEALKRLAELEQRVEAKLAEIQALPATVSNEELRTHLRELKDLWHTVRKEQRWVITQLINQKQDHLVDVYVRFGDRAEARINKLEEQGVEINAAEELLAKYREKVEELKLAQAEAQQAWMKAKEAGAEDALKEARERQQAFREKAKEAKASLRSLLSLLQELQAAAASETAGPTGGETENETENATEEE